ncbi:Crp/Fnr family transcriptional regulator [Brevundimonas sp.]|uniref:Crp/Fnr family transcriptional regulator n=1 Tax=Brevundimonas sp. TaxID=1871086 RepID=UPI001D1ECE22|nr:Crp/Fnr family transcriptional regulator [Brevundimonas sp.]MBA3999461.1 hypothetical protein [Brevundimonas sp.]
MSDATEPVYMAWARERFGKTAPLQSNPARTFRSAPENDRHPVLAALPPEVRLAVYRRGHLRDIAAGDPLSGGNCVLFILTGAVGLFPGDGSGICLGLAGPGSVINAEELADAGPRRDMRVLVKGAVLALRAPELINILGPDRADRLLIDQMLGDRAALDRAVACNALHLAPARLARWLLMLDKAAGGGDIHITQASLAKMLGIQRTSVNAAARRLQDRGALRFVRGRVRVLDQAALRAQACGCSAPLSFHK